MLTGDTIAAISSAVGPAARMIVRASGPRVPQIHQHLTSLNDFTAGAHRTELHFAGLSFAAWVYSFAAPHSVTGEDVIEFHIPGNTLLARMLLDELIRHGARQAEPGEFTARAYFNGKLDLAEAEGVAATIAAQNQQQLAAARQLMAGELTRRLRPILDSITDTLALLEAGIDFSEEDISFLTQSQIAQRIKSADAALANLLADSARFERLSHEPRVVLVGRPNAGKSTLLNALCGHDRAVVSPTAGTTRDVIWAHVRLPRGMVRMIDVAGLHEAHADGEISRQMQQRARRAVDESDIVVLVRDCRDASPPPQLPRRPHVVVETKIDLRPNKPDVHVRVDPAQNPDVNVRLGSPTTVQISAVANINLDALREKLDALCFGAHSGGATLALNARHVQAIEEARSALSRSASNAPAEILAMELRETLDVLGRVLGHVTPDDVLGRIFATFCVGK